MGAWGTETFENDAACDLISELEELDDLAAIEQAIADALNVGGDYLDAEVACRALAACDVLARLQGNFGVRSTETEGADAWVSSHRIVPPPELIARALSSIDRVVAEPSELPELWSDSDDGGEAWSKAVAALRERLTTSHGTPGT